MDFVEDDISDAKGSYTVTVTIPPDLTPATSHQMPHTSYLVVKMMTQPAVTSLQNNPSALKSLKEGSRKEGIYL